MSIQPDSSEYLPSVPEDPNVRSSAETEMRMPRQRFLLPALVLPKMVPLLPLLILLLPRLSTVRMLLPALVLRKLQCTGSERLPYCLAKPCSPLSQIFWASQRPLSGKYCNTTLSPSGTKTSPSKREASTFTASGQEPRLRAGVLTAKVLPARFRRCRLSG